MVNQRGASVTYALLRTYLSVDVFSGTPEPVSTADDDRVRQVVTEVEEDLGQILRQTQGEGHRLRTGLPALLKCRIDMSHT
jgi:hypothetical protein